MFPSALSVLMISALSPVNQTPAAAAAAAVGGAEGLIQIHQSQTSQRGPASGSLFHRFMFENNVKQNINHNRGFGFPSPEEPVAPSPQLLPRNAGVCR